MEVLHNSEAEISGCFTKNEPKTSGVRTPVPEALVEVKVENDYIICEKVNFERETSESAAAVESSCEVSPRSGDTNTREGDIKIKVELDADEKASEVGIYSPVTNNSRSDNNAGIENKVLGSSWQTSEYNEHSNSNHILPDGEVSSREYKGDTDVTEESLLSSTVAEAKAFVAVSLTSSPRTPRKRYRPRKFKCDKCDSAFKSGYDLRIHNTVHTGEKPYSCEVCGRAFARPGLVNNHMHVHTGVRKFTCDTCGRCFTTSSFLTVHKRVHTGERPFECDLCGQKFSASCTLIAHKRRHSEAKPFVCNTCGKAFKVSNDLHAHKQTHSGEKPYFCEICGKVFGRNSHLSAHMIVHKGGKPHVCSLCQVSFARPYNLTIHMKRQHPGEKTFVCEICADAFVNARELSNHKRTHKLEEEVVTSILA